VYPGHWVHSSQTETVKLGGFAFKLIVISLVYRHQNRLARFAQLVGYLAIGCRNALPGIHHQNYNVRFLHCQPRLPDDLRPQRVLFAHQYPSRVRDGELPTPPFRVGVQPVPGYSRNIFNDRQPPADDPVKEGGLPDVGTADQGNDRFIHQGPL